MATPTVRVNTLVQWKEKPFIDSLTKFYVVSEAILGLNRLPLFVTKYFYVYLPIFIVYTVALIFVMTYTVINHANNDVGSLIMYICEYTFCVIFGVITWKRMQRYFIELTTFDMEVGCRPKTAMTGASLRNLLQLVVIICCYTFFYIVAYNLVELNDLFIQTVPVHLFHALEIHYYGHLFSLLIPRLRLINHYAKASLSNTKVIEAPKVQEFIFFKYNHASNGEMKKLMDLYHIVIKAYDYLIEAIKWQFLVIIISTFISILVLAFQVSLNIIKNSGSLVDTISDVGLTVTKMLPLFSPCMFGDRVHNEVYHLRELLATRLSDNKLDKTSRRSARALLALTDVRDLSFSLLRMLEIDISFPFKFVGLLVTYLIILLQFEKVINP